MDQITKPMTVAELAKMGGIARGEKLSKLELQSIARSGGRKRADNMTPEQRMASSRKASAKRSENCKVASEKLTTALSS